MRRLQRFAPLLLILLAAVVAYATGMTRYLSLDSLQTHQLLLREFVAAHPVASVAAYVALYVVVTGAALPAALVLTLSGGLLFGPWIGGAATVVGSTIGATITYAAMRSAFGRPLRRRFEASNGRMRLLVDGFGKNAFAYILSLRLIPMAPYTLVNLAAGVADAPVKPYVLATFIGALPTSFLFASMGAGFGRAFAAGDAPGLALMHEPFVILPLLALSALALLSVVVTHRRAGRDQSSPPDSRVASSPK